MITFFPLFSFQFKANQSLNLMDSSIPVMILESMWTQSLRVYVSQNVEQLLQESICSHSQKYYLTAAKPTVCCSDSRLELNRPLLCLSLLVSGSLVDTHQRKDRLRASSSNPKDCPIISATGLQSNRPTFLSSPTIYTALHINLKALNKC